MTPIKIRPATEADHRFIIDSFIREYSKSPYARGATWKRLADKMRLLLTAPSWSCDVACPPTDETEIMGYVVRRESRAVGWLHVKAIWRRMGVATALVESAALSQEVLAAFVSSGISELASSRGIMVRFRPYLTDSAQDEIDELGRVA